MGIENPKLGTLFIVATPIGNLGDITLRAIEILKSVDIIACEDTRVSKKLLNHLNIEKKLISLHQHSGEEKYDLVFRALERGLDVAYITDGGTPGISDPGQEMIQRIRETLNPKLETLNPSASLRAGKSQIQNLKIQNNETTEQSNNVKVIPIPGPSAVAAAISVSGMVEKEFYFAGFLPKKKGRQTEFMKIKGLDSPTVIYESANRLEKTLNDIRSYLGDDSEVFIAREMTKMFEEYWGGNVLEVISGLKEHKMKGELVLIVKREK